MLLFCQNKKTYYHINNIKKRMNHELKVIDIKNLTCYYFDEIISLNDLDFGNILLDEKSLENI